MTSNERRDCGWILERIDLYVDAETDAAETKAIERHAGTCADCAAEIELARRITSELRSLPTHSAPAGIVERAEAAARAAAASSSPSLRERVAASLGAWARRHFEGMMRPAMAVMLLVVLAAGVFVITQRHRVPATQNGYTQAQIEEAAREARVAFAYVGYYTQRPMEALREDVMADRVLPRMERAMTESIGDVMEDSVVPAVEEAVLQTLFVEFRPRMIPSNP